MPETMNMYVASTSMNLATAWGDLRLLQASMQRLLHALLPVLICQTAFSCRVLVVWCNHPTRPVLAGSPASSPASFDRFPRRPRPVPRASEPKRKISSERCKRKIQAKDPKRNFKRKIQAKDPSEHFQRKIQAKEAGKRCKQKI